MPFFPTNNQRIFFEDSGGTGFPLVMMHGFLMDQSLFDPQINYLSPYFRCIRFDARAFGKTAWDGQSFTLYDTVSDCINLMDYLAIPKAVIVGMSQGGYAALRLAIHHPKRVQALVLMSTQAGIDNPTTIAQFTEMRDIWASKGPIEPLITGLAISLLGPKSTNESAWNYWLPKWKGLGKNSIFYAMNNLLFRDDVTSELSSINVAALVTHGDSDVGMPISLGRALSEKLKNCKKFVEVKGAAHAANFTHALPINKAMKTFLDTILDEDMRPRAA